MKETYKYKAFISYSHQDQKFAKWLHKKIENYKIPKSLREKYPDLPKDLKRTIFLDDEELPTASALPDNLSHALESSELLIVVCSPNATQSYWVDKEIAYFKQYHGEGKVLAVLKEGEPNATYSTVYDSNQEAFPKSLRYKVKENGELAEERTEPLAADARKGANKKKALIKLIAGILKVDFADLWKRDKKETRKRRIIIGLLFTLFIAVSIYASVQFLGEQGNKELEQINTRIATIEYSIRHDELPVEKVIALNKELKKLKNDKENKEASQKALGKLKTSLGKKAQKVYIKEGAKLAIEILTSKSALVNQESRLKDISKEKLALAKLYVETYEFEKAQESYKKSINLFFDFENAAEYAVFLEEQNYIKVAIDILKKLLKSGIIEEQKALVLMGLSKLYFKIGKYDEAEKVFIRALKTNSKVNINEYNRSNIMILQESANFYMANGRDVEAEENYNEAVKLSQFLAKKNPNKYNRLLADTLTSLASFYSSSKKYDEAEKRYNEALKLLRSLAKTKPNKYNLILVKILIDLAELYTETNKYEEVKRTYEEVSEISHSMAQINQYKNNHILPYVYRKLAKFYTQTNQYDRGEKSYKKALKLSKTLAYENPDVYNLHLAETFTGLAEFYTEIIRYEDAEEAYIEAVKLYKYLASKNPDVYNSTLVDILTSLASFYSITKKDDEAEKRYNEALKLLRPLVKINPEYYVLSFVSTNLKVARFYAKIKQYKEAEKVYNNALDLLRKVAKVSPLAYDGLLLVLFAELAEFYTELNQYDEAEKRYNEALKLLRPLVKINPNKYNATLADTFTSLAEFYTKTNQYKEAEKAYSNALKLLRKMVKIYPERYNPSLADILDNLGFLYYKTEQFNEAEKAYNEVAQIYRTLVETNPTIYKPDLERTLNNLNSLSSNN